MTESFRQEKNYWIFQANPKIYDIDAALKKQVTITWKINRFRTEVHSGDIVYYWKSGKDGGIVGKGEIVNEPIDMDLPENEKQFVKSEKEFSLKELRATVQKQQLFDPIIRRDFLLEHDNLRDLLILKQPQSSIYHITLEQSDAIDDILIQNNIWWVNQRDNFQQERDNKIIWAPIKDKADKNRYYWDTLKEVTPGDTILHYAKGYLRYVSCAKSRAQDITRPNDLKGYDASTLGRSVELEYHKLQHRVPLSKIKDSLSDIEIKQGPLDKNGKVKQGYLFRLTPEAFSLIRKASPETSWPSCLESNNQSSDQPKRDDGNTGKEKPDIPLNLILYGPPGTGKTCSLLKYAKTWFQTGEEKRWRMVTFHQSYGYEDFVEGLKPKETSGQVTYDIFDGIFKQMVTAARKDHSKSFALLVDEINRANISKVFGELITLLEKGKRLEWREESGKWEGDYRVKLPYTHTLKPDDPEFGVPDNLYVIGTMNTADRSIALLDTALRRRFDFRELMPDLERLANKKIIVEDDEIDMKELLNAINLRISAIYDREHQIGTSYFEDVTDLERLEKVFLNQIIPLLQEYFFDDWDKIKMVLNDRDDSSVPAIIERIDTSRFFDKDKEDVSIRRVYKMPTKITSTQLKRIYED